MYLPRRPKVGQDFDIRVFCLVLGQDVPLPVAVDAGRFTTDQHPQRATPGTGCRDIDAASVRGQKRRVREPVGALRTNGHNHGFTRPAKSVNGGPRQGTHPGGGAEGKFLVPAPVSRIRYRWTGRKCGKRGHFSRTMIKARSGEERAFISGGHTG